TGRSKKEAEQQAAESAWRAIRAAADARTGSGYGAEEFGPSEEIRSQLPLPFDRP
ncbi:putative dsRNA-binding protein, partial [Streptomyces umbrinus]